MRRTWIGTGWKMNFIQSEAEAYLDELEAGLRERPPVGVEVFVVPPFTLLREVSARARGLPLRVGAQNAHWEDRGAFTGEISVRQVKDCGVDLVELGHSERRAMFGETDAAVNRKVRAVLEHGLTPLVCVGETAEERALGAAEETVLRQAFMALHGVAPAAVPRVLLAYEPVWAIGEAGTPATPEDAGAMHAAIRAGLRRVHGDAAADRTCILYGGSVNAENARALLSVQDVDGLFVGRAAWKARGLLDLVGLAGEVRRRA